MLSYRALATPVERFPYAPAPHQPSHLHAGWETFKNRLIFAQNHYSFHIEAGAGFLLLAIALKNPLYWALWVLSTYGRNRFSDYVRGLGYDKSAQRKMLKSFKWTGISAIAIMAVKTGLHAAEAALVQPTGTWAQLLDLAAQHSQLASHLVQTLPHLASHPTWIEFCLIFNYLVLGTMRALLNLRERRDQKEPSQTAAKDFFQGYATLLLELFPTIAALPANVSILFMQAINVVWKSATEAHTRQRLFKDEMQLAMNITRSPEFVRLVERVGNGKMCIEKILDHPVLAQDFYTEYRDSERAGADRRHDDLILKALEKYLEQRPDLVEKLDEYDTHPYWSLEELQLVVFTDFTRLSKTMEDHNTLRPRRLKHLMKRLEQMHQIEPSFQPDEEQAKLILERAKPWQYRWWTCFRGDAFFTRQWMRREYRNERQYLLYALMREAVQLSGTLRQHHLLQQRLEKLDVSQPETRNEAEKLLKEIKNLRQRGKHRARMVKLLEWFRRQFSLEQHFRTALAGATDEQAIFHLQIMVGKLKKAGYTTLQIQSMTTEYFLEHHAFIATRLPKITAPLAHIETQTRRWIDPEARHREKVSEFWNTRVAPTLEQTTAPSIERVYLWVHGVIPSPFGSESEADVRVLVASHVQTQLAREWEESDLVPDNVAEEIQQRLKFVEQIF